NNPTEMPQQPTRRAPPAAIPRRNGRRHEDGRLDVPATGRTTGSEGGGVVGVNTVPQLGHFAVLPRFSSARWSPTAHFGQGITVGMRTLRDRGGSWVCGDCTGPGPAPQQILGMPWGGILRGVSEAAQDGVEPETADRVRPRTLEVLEQPPGV